MKHFHLNYYEKAFGNWLIDNHVQYIAVDEQKRVALGRACIKSFDYLLKPADGQIIIAEVKGRKFKGKSFAKLSGFECWVTTDDVDGLAEWQRILGQGHAGGFIFAYQVESVDVDYDGRAVYEFGGNRYIFFAVRLDDYRDSMKIRSGKWRTVTLPVGAFRNRAVQAEQFLL